MIAFYILLGDYQLLLDYIILQDEQVNNKINMTLPYYDMQFALRLCNKHGLYKCCVYILKAMNLLCEAVEQAIEV